MNWGNTYEIRDLRHHQSEEVHLLSLEFHNDMSSGILYEDKLEIAKKVLTDASELCFKALMKGV